MSMFRPSSPRHLPSFGLEISATAIRLALMDASRKKQRSLKVASETSVPQGLIDSGIIGDSDQVAALLKNLLSQARRHHLPKYVVAALPDEQCYILTVTLAKKDTDSLDESLRWEVTQHVPFSVDELYLDWALLSSTPDQDTYQVAAAPKSVVDVYAATIEKTGLMPIGFEAATPAALRALTMPEKGLAIVLSIGWSSTTLLVVTEHGVPISLVTDIFSGRRLTTLLVDQLKLKPAEAEKAKYVCGLDAECSHGVVRHTLWPEFTALVEKCRNLQDYAAEFYPKEECRDLIVVGSHSVVRSLYDELHLKTHLAPSDHALSSVLIPTEHQKSVVAAQNLPGYATTFGLALAQP